MCHGWQVGSVCSRVVVGSVARSPTRCVDRRRLREDVAEKRSGTTTTGRSELASALSYVRDGDTLIVTRLDRLARSAGDLLNILTQLTEKGVAFQCLQQSAIDTGSSTGKLLLGVLASIAEFEADIRRERQREGIERAKAAGVYKGASRPWTWHRFERCVIKGWAGQRSQSNSVLGARVSTGRSLNDDEFCSS